MEKIQFDYYRGMEAEQYSFYRVPKILFTAECFKELSCEAKVLYGLLLDRMSLSIEKSLAGRRRTGIYYFYRRRNCRVIKLRNAKSGKTAERTGQ